MRVPGFLVRRFYVQGSLRNTEGGFELQAHNGMGPGTIVGLTSITIDGMSIDPRRITAQRQGGSAVLAATISRASPVPVAVGDRVTIHVSGPQLAAGRHRLEVELVERDLGVLQLGITESLAEDPRPTAPVDC